MTNIYFNYRKRGRCTECDDILWSWANQTVYCKCGISYINDNATSMKIVEITDLEHENYIKNSETIKEGDIIVFNIV